MKIILASKSPRRKEILENLNVDFEIVTADTDETCCTSDGSELVKELSKRKADAVAKNIKEQAVIIGCDTVVCVNGKILGKPKTRVEAAEMLKELSGKTHSVISGLTVICGNSTKTAFEETKVTFDNLSEKEISDYISTGECDDKAGAYAIQGLAAKFIKGIDGCYFNVVGLPVNLLYKMLKEYGINI